MLVMLLKESFVSELVTVKLFYVELKEDNWLDDSWYEVNAVQNGVELRIVCDTLEEATVAFNELCNGFDTEAELARKKEVAEVWTQLESEVCTNDDYSIEE